MTDKASLMKAHRQCPAFLLAVACTAIFTGCATTQPSGPAATVRAGPATCVTGEVSFEWWEYALLPVTISWEIFKAAGTTPGVTLGK